MTGQAVCHLSDADYSAFVLYPTGYNKIYGKNNRKYVIKLNEIAQK